MTTNPTLLRLLDHKKAEKDPAVWASLDRKPDKRDPRSGELLAEGAPMATLLNVQKVIVNDKRWHGVVQLNEMSGTITINGAPLRDEDEIRAALWMDTIYDLRAKPTQVADVLRVVAEAHAFHPVRDYLGKLRWDGQPRASGLLATYLGADDTELHQAMSRCFLISCVARAMAPGCKVDTSLVLKGPQGSLKSTFFRTLCAEPEWFKDTPVDLRNKDAMLSLQGVWIYEFAELDSIRPREATTTKAFLSSQVDHFRPPYGRHFEQRDRQCVIVGTTNEDQFLTEVGRRFWPVAIGAIDIKAVEADRDQLWAEAVAAFKAKESWWLSDAMGLDLVEASDRFTQTDAWAHPISVWLSGAGPRDKCNPGLGAFSSQEVMAHVLELQSSQQGRASQMRVGAILAAMGCTRERRTWGAGGPRQWKWVGPGCTRA